MLKTKAKWMAERLEVLWQQHLTLKYAFLSSAHALPLWSSGQQLHEIIGSTDRPTYRIPAWANFSTFRRHLTLLSLK